MPLRLDVGSEACCFETSANAAKPKPRIAIKASELGGFLLAGDLVANVRLLFNRAAVFRTFSTRGRNICEWYSIDVVSSCIARQFVGFDAQRSGRRNSYYSIGKSCCTSNVRQHRDLLLCKLESSSCVLEAHTPYRDAHTQNRSHTHCAQINFRDKNEYLFIASIGQYL